MKQIFCASILSILTILPTFTQAQDLTFANAPEANIIHKTIIRTNGEMLLVKATLKVGTGDDVNCELTKTAGYAQGRMPDGSSIALDGTWLASVGLTYTCAEETFTSDGKDTQTIRYKLEHNDTTYTSAIPAEQSITF